LSLGEWEFFYFTIHVVGENFRNHCHAGASLAPLLELLWDVVILELVAVAYPSSSNSLVVVKSTSEGW